MYLIDPTAGEQTIEDENGDVVKDVLLVCDTVWCVFQGRILVTSQTAVVAVCLAVFGADLATAGSRPRTKTSSLFDNVHTTCWTGLFEYFNHRKSPGERLLIFFCPPSHPGVRIYRA